MNKVSYNRKIYNKSFIQKDIMKSAPIPLNKEEMDKIIDASIDNDFCYMLFMTAKTTGRRLGEYYQVRVGDIDFNKNIMVTQVLKRRKRVDKEAILTDEVARIIKQYIARHQLGLDDFLFRKVSYRQIQNLIKKYGKLAGIEKNVSFHNFRHYFITELTRKGWSYDKIAKLTGHSSIGTLSIYDHAVASDIKEDALNALVDI